MDKNFKNFILYSSAIGIIFNVFGLIVTNIYYSKYGISSFDIITIKNIFVGTFSILILAFIYIIIRYFRSLINSTNSYKLNYISFIFAPFLVSSSVSVLTSIFRIYNNFDTHLISFIDIGKWFLNIFKYEPKLQIFGTFIEYMMIYPIFVLLLFVLYKIIKNVEIKTYIKKYALVIIGIIYFCLLLEEIIKYNNIEFRPNSTSLTNFIVFSYLFSYFAKFLLKDIFNNFNLGPNFKFNFDLKKIFNLEILYNIWPTFFLLFFSYMYIFSNTMYSILPDWFGGTTPKNVEILTTDNLNIHSTDNNFYQLKLIFENSDKYYFISDNTNLIQINSRDIKKITYLDFNSKNIYKY